MEPTLFLSEEEIVYRAPSIEETGTVRYAPPFTVRLAEVKIVGYVPRIITDDESGFLVFVISTGRINYFNLDIVDEVMVEKLEDIFNFRLREIPSIPFEDTNRHSFIVYPQGLAGHSLFKSWSWLTPRGFLKNLGKSLSLDNPSWEQLTSGAQAYLAEKF